MLGNPEAQVAVLRLRLISSLNGRNKEKKRFHTGEAKRELNCKENRKIHHSCMYLSQIEYFNDLTFNITMPVLKSKLR